MRLAAAGTSGRSGATLQSGRVGSGFAAANAASAAVIFFWCRMRAQHVGAALDRGIGVRERIEVHRVLDEPGEQRGVAEVELRERRADDPLRGGLHAVGVGAEVHGVEVLLQDAALRPLAGEPRREDRLADLAVEVALRVREVAVLDQLLRDRRATLADAAGPDVREEGPHARPHVDARVVEEGVVLGRDHRVDQRLGHLAEVHRRAVQVAEAVHHVAVGVVQRRRALERAEVRARRCPCTWRSRRSSRPRVRARRDTRRGRTRRGRRSRGAGRTAA